MAMSPEAQAEYEKALTAVVLKRGSMVSMSASYHSWQDFAYEYGEYEDDNYVPHHHTCELVSVGKPKEDYWREFMGTFDEGDDSVHGIVLKGVTCACGRIENREFRWTANMQEVAAAVFEEAFGKKSDDAD